MAQLFAIMMMKEKNLQMTITRKTFPSLRATAMKDFFNILKGLGIYREENHNKSENVYRYKGNEIDFISVDEPTKIRSRRRQFLWMNEANEFDVEDFEQLNMRTEKQIFMDYNPSHQFHWIYDKLHSRKDCIVIPSTYKDNPFLPDDIVKEVERYQETDKNYWRIYGLGLRGMAETLIYTHWEYCDALPENPDAKFFGLDFGYNNQTAMVEIAVKDKDYYWDEKIYQRYMTNQDLIEKMKQLVENNELTYDDEIYADSADPARIEEIKQSGFNVIPCSKIGVTRGIDKIKSRKFFITKQSVNLQKEARTYSWKTSGDKRMEVPVKENDHLLDAGRYAIITSEMVLGEDPQLIWI